MIKIADELKLLSDILPFEIYIVGGYIRDSILNVADKNSDIDICASEDISLYKSVISNYGFIINIKNKNLGTYLIKKGDLIFEFSRLRREVYLNAGEYYPEKVEFIDSISEDAKRRDFTINSLYFSIKNNKIFDFYNGIDDIENGIIKAIDDPYKTLSFDATRLIRMIRLACCLGFKIENKTLNSAIKNAFKIKFLSENIILKEFKKIRFDKVLYKTTREEFINLAKWYIEQLNFSKYLSCDIMNKLFEYICN